MCLAASAPTTWPGLPPAILLMACMPTLSMGARPCMCKGSQRFLRGFPCQGLFLSWCACCLVVRTPKPAAVCAGMHAQGGAAGADVDAGAGRLWMRSGGLAWTATVTRGARAASACRTCCAAGGGGRALVPGGAAPASRAGQECACAASCWSALWRGRTNSADLVAAPDPVSPVQRQHLGGYSTPVTWLCFPSRAQARPGWPRPRHGPRRLQPRRQQRS